MAFCVCLTTMWNVILNFWSYDMLKKWFCAALLLVVFSCSNEPGKQAPGKKPAGVWAQYKVWAEEGDSAATCMLQFYTNERMAQTMLLQPPAAVQIDGQELQPDSAGVVGAFYEYQAPVARLVGKHTIRFTDLEANHYTDEFNFQPFTIGAELPAVLSVGDHELPLNGLSNGSSVRVVLTDTSAEGVGVNELLQVRNGKLALPAKFWENLAAGPIVMHLTAEEERPLNSNLGGEILITYGLSRIVTLRK